MNNNNQFNSSRIIVFCIIALMLSGSEVYAEPTETVYEDAEHGTAAGWDIYDQSPAGASIANVFDSERFSRVIEVSGSARRNGFRLRNVDGTPWNNDDQFVVEWSMRFDNEYRIYVEVETSAGTRYLTYEPVDTDELGGGTYIYHGLGTDSDEGNWLTTVRDLQADLATAQPGVVIHSVNAFLVRGSGRFDDIRLWSEVPASDTDADGVLDTDELVVYGTDPAIADTDGDGSADGDELSFWSVAWNQDIDADGLVNLVDADADADGILDGVEIAAGADPSDPGVKPRFASIYEDAEQGTTVGWDIYDQTPAGAAIASVFDVERGSQVIEMSGSARKNGFRLRNADGTPWNNDRQFVIEWSMKFASPYRIYVEVETSAGKRYLTYEPVDTDELVDGDYIYHGLGSGSDDGNWAAIARDLQTDLSAGEPGVTIQAVNAFLVRGSGRLDDIRLWAFVPTADTDDDSILDVDEIGLYGTNPQVADTDDDSISDGDELGYWSVAWNQDADLDGIANLIDADADSDGIEDGAELLAGADPGDAGSTPGTRTLYEDAEQGTTVGWDIYDQTPAGAAIASVFDVERGSQVIEMSGSARKNGFRLRNADGTPWNNDRQFVIEWSMKFASPYRIYVEVETSAGKRYLTYEPVDTDELVDGDYIYHGLGSGSDDGNWAAIARDLQTDLSAGEPGVTIQAVNAFLVRGSGRLDDIALRTVADVSNLTAQFDSGSITLTWSDPVGAAVDGIEIRRRDDGQYPQDPTDGILVAQLPVDQESFNEEFIPSGGMADSAYYTVFSQVAGTAYGDGARVGAYCDSYTCVSVPDLRGLNRVTTVARGAVLRATVQNYVWGQPGLPGGQPDEVETIVPDYRLTAAASAEELFVDMGFGVTSTMRLFTPVSSNNRLVIYHQGHRGNTGTRFPILQRYLEEGYSILEISMLSLGYNKPHDPGAHDDVIPLLPDPMRFFLEPVTIGLNYALSTQAFARVFMTGISGGGWTTAVYAALDERIDGAYPVAGSYPAYLREQLGIGVDFEQTHAPFYAQANYIELYLLGALGRRHLQVLNVDDDCCWWGTYANTYRDYLFEQSGALAGNFDVLLDYTATAHEYTPFAQQEILDDMAVQ